MEWLDVRMGHLQIIEAVEAIDNNPRPTRARARALHVAQHGVGHLAEPSHGRAARGNLARPTRRRLLTNWCWQSRIRTLTLTPTDQSLRSGCRGLPARCDLDKWHRQLVEHFELSTACFLGENLQRAADRIYKRISFLPESRVGKIMDAIRNGYRIPLLSEPPPFHRA